MKDVSGDGTELEAKIVEYARLTNLQEEELTKENSSKIAKIDEQLNIVFEAILNYQIRTEIEWKRKAAFLIDHLYLFEKDSTIYNSIKNSILSL